MDKRKKDKLEAFLGQIRDHDLDKFAAAVERDRLSGGTDLPHETLLEVMRPALRENVNQARIPSPERLFSVAFEDLINALPDRRKQTGRIGRGSVRPMWSWLKDVLLKAELPQIEVEVGKFIAEDQLENAGEVIRELQRAAGKVLHNELDRAVRSDEEYEALCKYLGGASIFADLRDMAMCLEIAGAISKIQTHFVRPLLGFTDDDLKMFRDIYGNVQEESPDHTGYVLLVLMGRMARPWEILSMIAMMEQQFDGFEVSAQDQALISDLLLDDVDIVGLTFVGLRPEDVDSHQLLENLNLFVQITGGVLRGVGVQRDEGWGQRFKTARDAVAQQMGAFCEALPGMILKSLPVKQTGGYGVRIPRVPDTGVSPDPDAVNASIELTRLFAELRFYADQTGFSAAWSRAAKEFDENYERFKNDILDHIRATSGFERQNAEAFAEVLAQIGEEYRGSVEADMIRRRAVAAADEADAIGERASG